MVLVDVRSAHRGAARAGRVASENVMGQLQGAEHEGSLPAYKKTRASINARNLARKHAKIALSAVQHVVSNLGCLQKSPWMRYSGWDLHHFAVQGLCGWHLLVPVLRAAVPAPGWCLSIVLIIIVLFYFASYFARRSLLSPFAAVY